MQSHTSLSLTFLFRLARHLTARGHLCHGDSTQHSASWNPCAKTIWWDIVVWSVMYFLLQSSKESCCRRQVVHCEHASTRLRRQYASRETQGTHFTDLWHFPNLELDVHYVYQSHLEENVCSPLGHISFSLNRYLSDFNDLLQEETRNLRIKRLTLRTHLYITETGRAWSSNPLRRS